jgi:hypothetical protein
LAFLAIAALAAAGHDHISPALELRYSLHRFAIISSRFLSSP